MEKPVIINGLLLEHLTINEYGRVWNHKRNKEQKSVRRGGKDGNYRCVKARIGGGDYVREYIHRLVAEQFIGPCPEPGMFVNHIDGDPFNNHVDNLEWVTPKENQEHYHRELKHLDRVYDDKTDRLVYVKSIE